MIEVRDTFGQCPLNSFDIEYEAELFSYSKWNIGNFAVQKVENS